MDVTIPCPCRDLRHPDGDTVSLRDRLDFVSVTTIRKAMGLVDEDDRNLEIAKQLAICTEYYLLFGIASWTLVDDKGKPLPVTHTAVRDLFERTDVLPISEAAERLYNPVVLLPLLNRASTSSRPTPTPKPESVASTSPTLIHPRPRKPSRRSSTSTTPTDGTETTSSSLDGVSSSSQSAA